MLKDTRLTYLTKVYFSFPSCHGSGHMLDPTIHTQIKKKL